MKRKLMVIGMALFGILNIVQSQTLVTNYNDTASPLWTYTGLHVTNGEWVNVNASGFWNWNGFTDPDGGMITSQIPLDQFVQNNLDGSLVAFIGDDPNLGSDAGDPGIFQTNRYFEVGTADQFMSTTNGKLWLGINDDAFGNGQLSDNFDSNVVTVSLGFSQCDNYSNMMFVASVSSNSFGFYISNGIPNSMCAIYDSADLVHWTLLDALFLDENGASLDSPTREFIPPNASVAHLVNGVFNVNTAVPYRFYKVSNGQFWSQAIGFVRINSETRTLGGFSYTLLADQLLWKSNTLNDLFNPMVDGSTLPDGAQIWFENSTGTGYDKYTFFGGAWSPNGNATLLPGMAAFLVLSNAATTVTFAGLVPQGCLTNIISTNAVNFVSSQVPQAGGITSVLGYQPVNGPDNEAVTMWTGLGWSTVYYWNSSDAAANGVATAGWYDQGANPAEPVLTVGEGCYITTGATNTEYWIRNFPGCCEP